MFLGMLQNHAHRCERAFTLLYEQNDDGSMWHDSTTIFLSD